MDRQFGRVRLDDILLFVTSEWHRRLGAAKWVQFWHGNLTDQDRLDRANIQARQNADDNGHAPTRRTRLAEMIGTLIIVHGVPMYRAVGVRVGDEMRFWMSADRGIERVVVTDSISPRGRVARRRLPGSCT
jgi:hypothetical protein